MSDEDEEPETLEERLKNIEEDRVDSEEGEEEEEEESIFKKTYQKKLTHEQELEEEEEEENEDEPPKKKIQTVPQKSNPKPQPKSKPIKSETYQKKKSQPISQKQQPKKKPVKEEKVKSGVKKKDPLYPKYEQKQKMSKNDYRINDNSQTNGKVFEVLDKYLPRDIHNIQQSIISHIEYTLARTRFDINNQYIFQGTALSVRDRLLEQWNDTQEFIRINNPKKIYYMSIEFLLGRLLQNALVCMNLENSYKDALLDLGIKIEEIYDKENDPALGNGGLGRLAACYIDSMATLNYPAWGYGIRYDYGIFKQVIENCEQKELPDYWLAKGNPWEIMRIDTRYKVRFYGYCRDTWLKGQKVRKWQGGEEVIAVAYDTAVPGYKTYNCNTLRLWKAFPSDEFDFDQFNKGEYLSAINEKNMASFITSVLYPNDNSLSGRELRLKQEYFFSSATIQNIVNEFSKLNMSWKDFPKYNCIQLNDTHPALAITELLRILIDDYALEYKDAFEIVKKSFNYTNHTVLPEALEKWGVDIFRKILPRHLELIYLINFYFMEEVKEQNDMNGEKMSRLSIIEESTPKQIRMGNLCVVASSKVNGVAKIHSGLIKTRLFKDFCDIWPNKFTNVTNGVTPRRWVHCAFPELSNLLTEYNDGRDDWLSELNLLSELPKELKKMAKKKNS